jgi:serine/threonine-protein kinase
MEDNKEVFEKRIGSTLRNKWTLERLLGVGGMASVYVAVHKIGRREAIKILHPDAARSNEMRARFEQEAHAVNRLGHPGVVEIRDIDTTEDGSPFLVMELLEGEPLSERAHRLGSIEVNEILRLVDELLDVLAVAHAQGIVHRDIKLDNLFVCSDGRLKVLDFGIAHMRLGASTSPRTRFGAKLGTAPYMPPEQVKGLPIDGRADLFAVGATMFRLLAKRRIHEANGEAELLMRMATTPAPPLASVAPDTPREVCLIVDRALAFDKGRRYPDAATMQDDVRAVRRGEPPRYAEARLAEGDAPEQFPSEALGVVAPELADRPTVVPPPSSASPPSQAAAASSNGAASGAGSLASPTAITLPDTPPSRVARTLVMDGSGAPSLATTEDHNPLPDGFGPPPSGSPVPLPRAASQSPVSLHARQTPQPGVAPSPRPAGHVTHTTVPETAPGKPMSRTMSIIAILALLVLTVAGAGLGWTLRGEAQPSAPPPSATPGQAPKSD